MACNVKTTGITIPGIESQKVAAAASRKRVCDLCERNKNGICMTTAAKHGKEKANIEHGVSRLSLKCPKGKWDAVSIVCPQCSRSAVVDEDAKVCKWCVAKNNTGRQHRVAYLARVIPGERLPMPFDGEPIRHLHYFLYPRFRDSTLYHLEWLERCADSFNGKKVCCVAIDDDTIQDSIADRLDELFDVVFFVRNDPAKREAAGFIQSLKHLVSKSPNEMICFAHGKGQQQHTQSESVVRKWTDAMYHTVVANWQDAADALADGYPLAGSFKAYGNFWTTPHRWHFSGTFFWGRSNALFENKAWQQMCDQWFAAESYVGRHFAEHEAFCLFGDRIEYAHNVISPLYIEDSWKQISADLEEWKAARQVCR